MEDTATNEVRRNDQPGTFNRLVCRSGRRAGQSGFTGDRVVAGFSHQGDGDAAAEVEAFKVYSSWCAEKAKDDGHQQVNILADITSTKAAIENDVAEVGSLADRPAMMLTASSPLLRRQLM